MADSVFEELKRYVDWGPEDEALRPARRGGSDASAPSPRRSTTGSWRTTAVCILWGIHGLRMARKHISWYTKGMPGSASFRHAMNQLPTVAEQLAAVEEFFAELGTHSIHLMYHSSEELAAA